MLSRLSISTRSSSNRTVADTGPPAPELNVIRQGIIAAGGFARVQRGTWVTSTKDIPVAVKDPMHEDANRPDRIAREVRNWMRTNHVNVLPCYGTVPNPLVYNNPRMPSFVSPFVPEGHLTGYCKTRGIEPDLRRQLILDVATGLEYLHAENMVHGDLKGENVLVTHALCRDGGLYPRAMLADFGLAKTISEDIITLSSIVNKGSQRWKAWELHDPGKYKSDFGRKDIQEVLVHSDMWSWGMTVLEIFSERPPYASIPDNRVQATIVAHHLPVFTVQYCEVRGMTSVLQSLMKDCWKRRPKERPTAASVVQALQNEVHEVDIECSYNPEPGSLEVATPTRQLTHTGREPVLFYARTARRSHPDPDVPIPESAFINPVPRGWLVAVTKIDNVTGWWDGRELSPLTGNDPWIPHHILEDHAPESSNPLNSCVFPYITRAIQSYESGTWTRMVKRGDLFYITEPPSSDTPRYKGSRLKDLEEKGHCTFPCNHVCILPHGKLKQEGVICWGLFTESFGLQIKVPRSDPNDLVFSEGELVAVTHAPLKGAWLGELVHPGERSPSGSFPRDAIVPL